MTTPSSSYIHHAIAILIATQPSTSITLTPTPHPQLIIVTTILDHHHLSCSITANITTTLYSQCNSHCHTTPPLLHSSVMSPAPPPQHEPFQIATYVICSTTIFTCAAYHPYYYDHPPPLTTHSHPYNYRTTIRCNTTMPYPPTPTSMQPYHHHSQ